MSADYRQSHLAPEKGQSYHSEFLIKPYRSMIWHLEQKILNRILEVFYANKPVEHLDFACGTGRILAYLESRTQTSVGVDVSASMLAVAHRDCQHAELIEGDMTREDLLGSRRFNLITAFRFFPNAESGLRLEVMHALVKYLKTDGYIVFNNHKNTGSSRNRLARAFGRKGFQGMSMSDVEALLRSCDLEIADYFSLGIFPASDKRMLLPRVCLRPIESFLSRCRSLRPLGENLIFVCRRIEGDPPLKL